MKRKDDPMASVIVPVYNPGEAIDRCIHSLREQTLRDIEIIFIDDHGSDGAMQRVRRAAEADSRIRILENPANSGPGVSRNAGIEVARGKYLAFVDSDDYIGRDFLELLCGKAEETGARIVRGNFVEVDPSGSALANSKEEYILRKIHRGISRGEPLYSLFTYSFSTAVYLRQWIIDREIRFGSLYYGEDALFLLKACHLAKTMALEEHAVYYYVQNGSSLMHTLSESRLTQQLELVRQQIDYLSREIDEGEYSIGYAISRMTNLLALQATAARQPGLREASRRFLADLRQQAQRLPMLKAITGRSPEIGALIGYGRNICGRSQVMLEEAHSEAPCLDDVQRIVGFAAEHPERGDFYVHPFRNAVGGVIDYGRRAYGARRTPRRQLQRRVVGLILDRRDLSAALKARLIFNYTGTVVKAMVKR